MTGDRRSGWRGKVSITALLLLLLLHHPVMSLMPVAPASGDPGQALGRGSAMPMAPLIGGSETLSATTGAARCSDCTMACPLMDGITPHRSFLSLHRGGQPAEPSSAIVRTVSPAGSSVRVLRAGVVRWTCTQRIRRALLQVYLL